MLKRLRDNRGDTIVEVLIVLAVLGLAIGISYATANRSLLNARQAQENSEASELLQSQAELLRTLSNDPAQNIYQAGPYCINAANTIIASTGSPNPCTMGPQNRYTVAITTTGSLHDTFTLTATWDDIIGNDPTNPGGKDTVTLVYRIHK